MLPSAGGSLPLVIMFNTGLVVLAVMQLILALSLSNLVMRTDSPPLLASSVVQTLAPWLCLSDLPLIGEFVFLLVSDSSFHIKCFFLTAFKFLSMSISITSGSDQRVSYQNLTLLCCQVKFQLMWFLPGWSRTRSLEQTWVHQLEPRRSSLAGISWLRWWTGSPSYSTS